MSRSGKELLYHLGLLYPGEALIEALVFHGEPFVIVAEEVEDGGVEIADVEGILDDIIAEVVGLPVDGTALASTARHPHGEATWMVIAAVVRLAEAALAVDLSLIHI